MFLNEAVQRVRALPVGVTYLLFAYRPRNPISRLRVPRRDLVLTD